MRDAPSRVVIQALLRAGASITCARPRGHGRGPARGRLDLMDAPHCLERIRFADKPIDALPAPTPSSS
jgi:UDPglucose 6-dehydrogenase